MKSLTYAKFFESMSKNTSQLEYSQIFSHNVKFKDPFHDIEGISNLFNIFQDMYSKLDNPRFVVNETIEKDNISYLKWTFLFSFKNSSTVNSFEGVSRVEFNEENKAISHTDYWDTSENLYEKVPILASIFKLIKRIIKS